MKRALVPKWVTPRRSTAAHSTSSDGCDGEPSKRTMVAPSASAEISQFHIIQPQVVK